MCAEWRPGAAKWYIGVMESLITLTCWEQETADGSCSNSGGGSGISGLGRDIGCCIGNEGVDCFVIFLFMFLFLFIYLFL